MCFIFSRGYSRRPLTWTAVILINLHRFGRGRRHIVVRDGNDRILKKRVSAPQACRLFMGLLVVFV